MRPKMLDDIFFKHIKDNLSGFGNAIKYGSAENITAPYTVMMKVSDPENKIVLCNNQGESGQALFQFVRYTGGNRAPAANSIETVKDHDAFKVIINAMTREIGTTPNAYRLIGLKCTSAKPFNDGSQELMGWSAIFECFFMWEKF